MASSRTGKQRVSREAYEAIFEHTADGVLFTIPDGTVLAANPAACRLLRMTEAELLARGRDAVADLEDDRWIAGLAERRRTGHVRAEVPLRRGDGTVFIADLSSDVFVTEDGATHACVIFRDVSERMGLLERQARLVEELQHLAFVDELTGLRSRRGFFAGADQELSLAAGEGAGIALLYADLDRLKEINDGVGHAAGDAAIVAVADAIRHATRPADLAARVGGDEFVVLLHGADEHVAERVVERIRRELDGVAAAVPLAVSVGVAVRHPGAACAVDELLAEADRRMYAAKASRQPAGAFSRRPRGH